MKIEVSLNNEDSKIFNNFAKKESEDFQFMTMYSVVDMVLNDLEDEKACLIAMENFKKDPVTYTHAEIKEMFGLA